MAYILLILAELAVLLVLSTSKADVSARTLWHFLRAYTKYTYVLPSSTYDVRGVGALLMTWGRPSSSNSCARFGRTQRSLQMASMLKIRSRSKFIVVKVLLFFCQLSDWIVNVVYYIIYIGLKDENLKPGKATDPVITSSNDLHSTCRPTTNYKFNI